MGQIEKNAQVEDILTGVARTLHHWRRLERSLLDVLSRCMDARDPGAADIVWENITPFPQKLRAMSDMLKLRIHDDMARDLWTQLSRMVCEHSRLRLQLSQYQIQRVDNAPRLVLKTGDESVIQLPSARTAQLEEWDPILSSALEAAHAASLPSGYTAVEIDDIAQVISDLADNISWYSDWVIEYGHIPSDYAPPPPPLINAMLGELQSQAVSGNSQPAYLT
ncbi:hypothetical protein [Aminobacter sp. J44]|uniref:hypothetical protein n=1 Tax=Aminobacter sp. J44 TaxID=935262 RepID=UPI001199B597|nr:hypothetical protein [Aminobacter sp. J44]TWG53187.1 hypothetical protein L610_005300000050 [Aminobacter sp. J44]